MNLQFEYREARKEFIKEMPSNRYDGENVNGEEVVVLLSQGEGMEVKTRKHTKPNWYEVVEYDNEGVQVSVTYERI